MMLLISLAVAAANFPVTKPGEVLDSVGVSKPFICKNGKRPELPGPIISRCRAEFLGLKINGDDGPFYNPAPGIIMPWGGHCSMDTEWSKREGGDGRFYSDEDFTRYGRPRRGAKPCE